MIQLRLPLILVGSAMIAGTAAAQVVTWGGGFPNDKYSVATNWVGGVEPLGDGTETLQFNDGSDSILKLNVAGVSFLGISVPYECMTNGVYTDIVGTNSLTIGSGGITIAGNDDSSSNLTLDVPLVFAANQVWSQTQNDYGYLQANGAITGAYSLALQGDGNYETYALTSGASTFSGGVTLSGANSILFIGSGSTGPAGAPTSGPVGTGTLVLGDGTSLSTFGGNIALANALTLGDQTTGDSITFGGSSSNGQFGGGPTRLTLSGPVLLNDFDIELDMASASAVTFSGPITGYTPGVCLDFGGQGVAIVQGALSNVDRIDLEDSVSVIFNGTGSGQVTGLGDFGTGSNNYLGFGASYAAPGNMAAVINFLATTNPDNFQGTLGFDTITGPTAVFVDPINLAAFPNEVMLGSATRAILGPTAVITPNGGTYAFGGGGGTLTVQSSLVDGEGSFGVSLNPGNSPLTLILSNSAGGAFTYTGNTTIGSAALIFDAPLPPGEINLNHGYLGVTPSAGFTDANSNIQQFVGVLQDSDATGVIGFDTLSGPITIASPIDMSVLSPNLYLGTATSVTYTGPITPYGSTYQFAGVKGGVVTVASTLSDNGTPYSVEVGLPNPIESFNPVTASTSISTVTLSGANSYSGGTTLNSGILLVTNDNSLGTGPLVVPGPEEGNTWVASLAASGAPVTLANPISLPGGGLSVNFGSSNLLTLAGTLSDYGSDSGSVGIYGPVTLSGANTYSGTTYVSGTTLTVANDTGVGTSFVNASNSTLHFTSPSPEVTGGMYLYGTTATFDGNPVLQDVQLQLSTINFNGATAVINNLEGDNLTSANVINLGPATQLTLNDVDGEGGSYHGVIAGTAGSSLVLAGSGNFNLSGGNTYGGGTTIEPGIVAVASSNSAFGTGPVSVASGSAIATNTGVTITNPIALSDGSGLAGYGTYSPATPQNFTFRNGSILDPGSALIDTGDNTNSIPGPGKITFGGGSSLTFASGGSFIFSISDAAGLPGVGYGTVALGTGSLTITNSGSPFDIQIYSFDPATNASGQANNFNPANPYSWTLLSAASISGFNPSYFVVDPANFLNSTGTGSFFVSQSGGDLLLNFTPVPEPSTWALMASGLCALGAAVRRRRR